MEYLMQSAWFDGAMVCLGGFVLCILGMVFLPE